MAKRTSKLNIYDDTWIKKSFTHVFDTVLRSPVRFTIMPKKERQKSSSKHDSSKNKDCMYIAYCFRGYPTKEQASMLSQIIGSARFIWNKMLADTKKFLETRQKASIRPAQYKGEYPWLRAMDSYALCNVQLNLERTISSWQSGECGEPKFKKKHVCRDSYTTNKDSRSNNIFLGKNQLRLPKVPGLIRVTCHRKIQPGGVLKSVTVSHEPNGTWLFSILFEYPKQEKSEYPDWVEQFAESGDLSGIRSIGLDMSLPHLYIDSDGQTPSYTLGGSNGSTVSFSKHYKKLERQIVREQRKLSHMVKDSHNYEKQLIKIAKLHAKAKHARNDFLRQMAIRLARNYDLICIEDLDMRAMKQALKFGKSVSDNGWGKFTTYLESACEKTGSMLLRVDKWFPSSKTCLHCGHVKHDLKLNDRTYICPKCGHVMDRDYQAACNIREEGLHLFAEVFDPGRPVKMIPA